jgi:hypothetical protein
MKGSIPPRSPRLGRWQAPGCVTLLVLLATGCASPGPPRAPSLHLPEVVKDLSANRTGDQVQLHWTTPSKTTDGLVIKGALTAQICRVTAPSTLCTPVKRLSVHPGPSQTAETLPRARTLDPPVLLAYRVQIFNSVERSAGLSKEAFAAAGATPPPVEQLRITPIRTGARVEWRQQDTSAVVELDRLLDGASVPAPKPASNPAPKPSKSAKHKSKAKSKPPPPTTSTPKAKSPLPAKSEPAELKLQTPSHAADAGGTIDRTAERGQTYRYIAQRVRTETLDGHSLQLRSPATPPVTVLMRDTFPPQPPSGLAAIPGEGVPASIDLSWEPNTDPDLAGYIVYRQKLNSAGSFDGPASRLNPTPVPEPAYRDQTALLGQTYAYRVTAVDTVGNESAPSADVQEKIREQ